MANTKPFVATACFCENVLEDKDGVLSAIRIVDTYLVPPLPDGIEIPRDGIRGVILLKGLITLRSGDVVGPGTIRLVMHKTNGERVSLSPAEGWPVDMKGEEHGVNVKLMIPLGVRNLGLLWFDVLWGDEILTRIPLRLRQVERTEIANARSS